MNIIKDVTNIKDILIIKPNGNGICVSNPENEKYSLGINGIIEDGVGIGDAPGFLKDLAEAMKKNNILELKFSSFEDLHPEVELKEIPTILELK